ncbi:MAG: SIMPL domain-containing protein [Gemmatimonadaceae bacterium]
MIRFMAGLAFALLTLPMALDAQESSSNSAVSANGRGEIRLKPTKAAISFTVQAKGTTAALAASENAKLVAQTMRSLLDAGLRQDDISNSAYAVGPNYEFSSAGRKQDGFIATNVIRVEISNISSVGKIIDSGLSGGATSVSSAQYTGDNMGDARRNALKEAVDEARRDAETMAAAAGGSLGRLLSLTSALGGPGPRDTYFEMQVVAASAGPTLLRPSEVTVIATATGRWEFIPTR